MDPLSENPLDTRSDLQQAVRDLAAPLASYRSEGGARLRPGTHGALFPDSGAEVEGFSRPLWGLVPLAAGGGEFDGWDRYREGFANGTDPDHPEYWGTLGDNDQKAVEMAAMGVGLAMLPDELWEPLSPAARERLADWLGQVNDVAVPDNNWRFFRVLANAGLRNVGADHDWQQVQADLDRLEEFYLGDGWYADGPGGHCDYYSAWEMHVDGLVYAALVDDDRERAARFRERAAAFAEDFRYWFAPDGAALPYGRSLTYRFAQASFWGALALADVDHDLGWDVVKGLWLRNLRWWADQSAFTPDGVLSVGYAYPTLKTGEAYNSPSSPYWAMKFFLPLALSGDHPFWQADPAPLPDLDAERELPHANMVAVRDGDHVAALSAGQPMHYVEKYNKFAYSTAFGFTVATSPEGSVGRAPDSTLALTDDGVHYRVRADPEASRVDEGVAYSEWCPWSDVVVETWLVPATPWHVRLHRLDAARDLDSVEGGFALDRTGDDDPDAHAERTGAGVALARYPGGCSGVRDCHGGREGDVLGLDPNANLLHPRTVAPVLEGEHDAGTAWLATAVLGSTDPDDDRWDDPPDVAFVDGTVRVLDGDELLFETDR